MTVLQVPRLIYGRVEAEYSRTGTGGLQTLWRTPDLRPDLTREIEALVRCFDAEKGTRLQFTDLSDGRFLISETRPSRGPAVDRRGRGTFICQALILTPQELHELGGHPVRIAAANPFDQDLPALLEELGRPPLVIEAQPLRWPPANAQHRPAPPTEMAEALLRSAFRAASQKGSGAFAFLQGSPEEARRVLTWVFDTTPVRLRHQLTFTTQVDRCPLPPGRFWLAAGSHRPAGRCSPEIRLGPHPRVRAEPLELEAAEALLLREVGARGFQVDPQSLATLDAACRQPARHRTLRTRLWRAISTPWVRLGRLVPRFRPCRGPSPAPPREASPNDNLEKPIHDLEENLD